MKKYCQSCGSPVNYSLNSKPKFCPECGESMFGKESKSKPKIQNSNNEKDALDDEEDFSHDVQEWNGTSISSLDVEITPSHDASFKLGQLFPEQEQEKRSE